MNIDDEIRNKIENIIPDAQVDVISTGRHFSITVTSSEFEGKSTLVKQKLVYSAIAPLMSGSDAPIHAVDTLKTLVPVS